MADGGVRAVAAVRRRAELAARIADAWAELMQIEDAAAADEAGADPIARALEGAVRALAAAVVAELSDESVVGGKYPAGAAAAMVAEAAVRVAADLCARLPR